MSRKIRGEDVDERGVFVNSKLCIQLLDMYP